MKKLYLALIVAVALGLSAMAQSSPNAQTAPASGNTSVTSQRETAPSAANPAPSASGTQQGTSATSAQPSPASAAGAQSGAAAGNTAGNVVFGAVLSKTVDAKKAKEGDTVEAKLVSELISNGQVVVPKDSKLLGHVTQAKARTKEQPESSLGLSFDKIVTKDGKEIPLRAEIQAVGAPPQTAASMPSDTGPVSPAGPSAPAGTTGGMSGQTAGAAGRMGTSAPSDTAPPTVGGPTGAPSSSRAASPGLTASSTGVVGIEGVNLQSSANGSVLTSNSKNVKLEGGTQFLLRVVSQ